MAEKRKKQSKLLTFGYIRIHKLTTKIPTDIINMIFKFYFETFIILKFSSKFIEKEELSLSDDDTCVTRVYPTFDRKYVLVDIDPVQNGIHCWRIQVIIY